MPEEMVIRHCAPTLAGLKTGSLFSCHYDSEQAMWEDVRTWNRMLVPKGLRVLSLRCQKGLALIYLYRPDRLVRDLEHPEAVRLLAERGYPCGSPDRCVLKLMGQLRQCREFPHEIGLFLGYPPDDVAGFIRCGAKCFKCVGDWKVYGDEAEAKRLFARYRACTRCYQDLLRRGSTVEQLAVATGT